MDQTLRSELVGTAGLSVGAGIALLLTILRAPRSAGNDDPGLVTSPLLAVWRKLMTSTEPHTNLRRRDALLLLEAIIFTIVVPGTATIWLPRDVLGLWGNVSRAPWAVWHVAAVVLIAIGFAVYARCVWDFAARGRGIPAPIDHPKQLVVTGLYRYVRNPMYVGVLLVMLGEALFFRSLPLLEYTLLWLAIVHTVILVYEEPNLRRKFGSSYDDYAAEVGRWIPGRAHHVIEETEVAEITD
jgi:protein-S-isoprenylcysteine O-methyltransferase Ste14